jgi:hypothetical protein
MAEVGRRAWARQAPIVLLATAALLATGCPSSMKKPETRPPEPVDTVQCDYSRLETEIDRLKREAQTAGDTRIIEDRIAALQLRVLEKDALVKSLRVQVSTQQVELDETIGEVVRSKAKLRSLDSRAQAASDMAEGEIALKAVKARYTGAEQPPAIALAEQLLSVSAREFEKQNYGGSLYLSGQARTKIRSTEVQARLRGNLDVLPGEVRFATPMELKVTKASKLRKAPGLDADVLATLQPGTAVLGLSYKGNWVRVECGDRSTGWVFQALLAGLD